MNTTDRETVLQSQLDDLNARNELLRVTLRDTQAMLDGVRAEKRGTRCRHCRKPVRDVNGAWRDDDWLTFCGVGDAKHST